MENKRFARTEMLLGAGGMEKLAAAKVMVVGIGAVGGYCVEALARAGIGHFVLADFDVFEESNVNRQLLAVTQTIGQKKADVAKARVLAINPQAEVEVKDIFVNEDTLDELLDLKPDFVIDAIDALNPKCCLMQALSDRKIPFVSSMGAALKTDASKIKYGVLENSRNCPLAKFIRKRLRKRGVDISKVNCVWSDEQVELPASALQLPDNPENMGRVRHDMGSLPTIPAIFGLTIANQAILMLSGLKKH